MLKVKLECRCIFLTYFFNRGISQMKEPEQKLLISKKLKGEDGHKIFSVRIKDETVARLDDIAKKTNRSRNDLINMLLDYAMDYCEIV